MKRLLVTFSVAFFILFVASTPSFADDPQNGLRVEVYTFDPGTLPDHELNDKLTLCEGESVWTSVPNMNFDVGGDVVAGCQNDFVAIHYSGWLTSPVTGAVVLQSFADDGFYLTLDGEVTIDDWTLKGCSGSSVSREFVAGQPVRVDAWWYEYGGGACNILYAQYGDFFGPIESQYFTFDQFPIVVPVDPGTPVDPPIEPPVVEPPVVEPPIVEPPIVDPPIDPPVVEPPVVKPPVVEPPVIVPPVVEPPVVVPPVQEPTSNPVDSIPDPIKEVTLVDPSTIDPQALSEEEVTALVEFANLTLATADPGSTKYEQALEQLFVAAQADDLQVSEELASVPVLGNVSIAVVGVLNYLGNVGADMSPKARATAKKEIVSAVVLTQIATSGAVLATQSASAGSSAIRRKL